MTSPDRPLDFDGLVCILRTAAAKVKAAAAELSQLDAATGDGDHGVAVSRAMEAIETGVGGCPDKNVKTLLQSVAWAIMSIDAGSTGPLLGSLFMGIAEPVGEAAAVDAPLLASMFAAGLAKMKSISKAAVGDKTMMDALVPAVAALNAAADAGDTISTVLDKAAAAAQAGAEHTKTMRAKFGRARNLGERSIGHQDPGATSMALLIRGLAEGTAGLES